MKSLTNVPTKKENVRLHDSLDELAIQFARDLQQQAFGTETLDEHQLLDAAKSILEAASPVIERATGKKIEFVDTDY